VSTCLCTSRPGRHRCEPATGTGGMRRIKRHAHYAVYTNRRIYFYKQKRRFARFVARRRIRCRCNASNYAAFSRVSPPRSFGVWNTFFKSILCGIATQRQRRTIWRARRVNSKQLPKSGTEGRKIFLRKRWIFCTAHTKCANLRKNFRRRRATSAREFTSKRLRGALRSDADLHPFLFPSRTREVRFRIRNILRRAQNPRRFFLSRDVRRCRAPNAEVESRPHEKTDA
jgi:hypothetical protein